MQGYGGIRTGSERSAEAERRRKVKVQDRRWPVANATGGRRISAALALPSANGDGIPSSRRVYDRSSPEHPSSKLATAELVACPQIFPINIPFSQNVGIMLFLGEFYSINSLKKHS